MAADLAGGCSPGAEQHADKLPLEWIAGRVYIQFYNRQRNCWHTCSHGFQRAPPPWRRGIDPDDQA